MTKTDFIACMGYLVFVAIVTCVLLAISEYMERQRTKGTIGFYDQELDQDNDYDYNRRNT